MKTAYEKYLIHLNIKYDEKELFKEGDKLTFKEFAPTHCYFRSTWLKAALKKDFDMFPHINRLYKNFTGSIVRAYRQKANSSVHMHIDPATLCSINIIVSEDNAPVIFEEFGEIYYKCALFNTSLNHAVPAHNKERLLLKFSYLDTPYDVVKSRLASDNLLITSS